MNLKNLLEIIKKHFDDNNVEFALIGGLAVGSLGYQRFTNDIDIIIHEEDRERVKKILLQKGFSIFSENPEFLQFQGPCPIDIQIARRPISQKMLSDAQILPSLNIKCLRPEDIIGLKIQAYAINSKREFKEKADIQALIERLSNKMDWDRIRKYADLFGKWPEIDAIRKKVSYD